MINQSGEGVLLILYITLKKEFLYKLLKIKFVKNIFLKTGGDHFDIGTTNTAITPVGELGESKI